jgi:hypothetical protein
MNTSHAEEIMDDVVRMTRTYGAHAGVRHFLRHWDALAPPLRQEGLLMRYDLQLSEAFHQQLNTELMPFLRARSATQAQEEAQWRRANPEAERVRVYNRSYRQHSRPVAAERAQPPYPPRPQTTTASVIVGFILLLLIFLYLFTRAS